MDSKGLEQHYKELELREHLEHRDVLLAIGVLLKQKEGLKLFQYLFKHLDVAQVPPQNMEGLELHEYLGLLRAGNSIYKLVCEADFTIAGTIIAEIERKKYDDIIAEYKLNNSK